MICINNHIGEVVYTKSSKTILDIGLKISSLNKVATRASDYFDPAGFFSHFRCSEYGGVEYMEDRWIRSGVYISLEEWSKVSCNRSPVDIAYILGILPPDIEYTPNNAYTHTDISLYDPTPAYDHIQIYVPNTYIPSTSIQEAIDKHPNDYEGLLKDLKALLRTHDIQALE